MYEYRCQVIRVVDGDTVWLDVELGFDVRRKDSFRLAGINAPEMAVPEGRVTKRRLEEMLTGSGELYVRTVKDKREKYGRYLAVLIKGGIDLNAQLLDEGLAVPY